MRARMRNSILGIVALGVGLTTTGCGGSSADSEIAATAGPPEADAPKTAAEYEAKYPVANAGDQARPKGRGPLITNP